MISNLHFMRPEWLWLALPALLFSLLLWRHHRQHGSWSDVIEPALLSHLVSEGATGKRRNWAPWILLAWLLAALAAAGPAWQKIPLPVLQKQDALVVVLDLSYSMKAGDLAPTRIDRARQKIHDVLRSRQEGQTALVAFAGDAHVVTPLTDDTPTIANLLPALNPDMMPVAGSEPVAAVELALQLLRSAGIHDGRILLVSDGISDADITAITKLVNASAIQLSILGVGTATGAPMPLPKGGFVKDASGAIVTPKLEEAKLRALAGKTQGRYSALRAGNDDIDFLLSPATELEAETSTITLERNADTWVDEGYWLMLMLLPMTLMLFRRGWLLSLIPLGLLYTPTDSYADAWSDLWQTRDQQGQSALQAGDTQAAQELFENPQWAGTAAYQQGDFEAAAEKFASEETADAWYNRGNALARAGKLDEAKAAYEKSLQLDPDQEDALANLELLEEIEKQQQEQQQSGEGDDNQEQSEQQDGEQNSEQDQQSSSGEQDSDDSQSQSSAGNESQQQPQNQQQSQHPSNEDGENEEAKPEQSQEKSDDTEAEQQQNAQPASGENSPEQDQTGQVAAQPGEEQISPEQEEQNQAMEQWLRRVPDDPSGLLRAKFRYESQQKQRQGQEKRNDSNW